MKRCPACRRDYYDDSLLYCLDDGVALLEGPASADEPATAILHETVPPAEEKTRVQIHATDQSESLQTGTGVVAPQSHRLNKRLLVAPFLLAIIVLAGFFGYRYLGSNSKRIDSIAVLPFANASGDKETEYMSDGISETLINNFTKIPELKVAARSTAFRFRGREGEPQAIGRELSVGSILTGNVLQRGDSVSIQVDLVDTTDGLQIWGDRYEGKVAEIVNIQQKIATDVSSQLKLKLTGAQTQQIAKTYTQNAEAYQHYLRGRFYWNRRTGGNLDLAKAEFQQATDIDPNYALAYVGLADCYALLDEYGGLPTAETLPKAKAYADKALALDENLSEVHASLGVIHQKLWQWDESGVAFARAIELNPNYPTTYHWYSLMLRYEGHLDRAHEMIKKGAELDPLSLIIRSNLATSFRSRGEFDAALAECRGIQALDPSFVYGNECFGSTYIQSGRSDEAIAEYKKFAAADTGRSTAIADLGSCLARAGHRDEAYEQAERLEAMFAEGRASAVHVAQVYSALEENDKAFEWLEKAFDRREGSLPEIAVEYYFKPIKKDPRFDPLLARMGLR